MTTPIPRSRSAIDQSTPWRPDPLLKGLLLWTSLVTAVLVWLPMVRGLIEGPVYQWAFFVEGIGGRGTGGAYPILPIAAAFAFSLFYLGWRGARHPFHWLLLICHGALTAVVIYEAVAHPDRLFWEGATVGIRFSLVSTGPVLFGSILVCAVFWVVRDVRSGRHPAAPPWIWTRSKQFRLAVVIGLVPIQVFLLRTWGPFGAAAMVGVGLTLWQWFMITYRLLEPAAFSSRNHSQSISIL